MRAALGPILCLDVANSDCSAGVFTAPGGVATAIGFHGMALERGHADALFPVIDAALAKAGTDWRALSAVVVLQGPGSFTGVRIGVAAARGAALALGAASIGVDGFMAYAAAARLSGLEAQEALVAFGRAPRLIWRRYDLSGSRPVEIGRGEGDALPAEQGPVLGPTLGPTLGPILGPAGTHPIAPATLLAAMAAIAVERLGDAPAPTAPAERPTPQYLRPPDAAPSNAAPPPRLAKPAAAP